MKLTYFKNLLLITCILVVCVYKSMGQITLPTINIRELEAVSTYKLFQFKQFALKKGFKIYEGHEDIYYVSDGNDRLYLIFNEKADEIVFLTESRDRYMNIKKELPANGYEYGDTIKGGYEVYLKNKFVVNLKKNSKQQYEIGVRYEPELSID